MLLKKESERDVIKMTFETIYDGLFTLNIAVVGIVKCIRSCIYLVQRLLTVWLGYYSLSYISLTVFNWQDSQDKQMLKNLIRPVCYQSVVAASFHVLMLPDPLWWWCLPFTFEQMMWLLFSTCVVKLSQALDVQYFLKQILMFVRPLSILQSAILFVEPIECRLLRIISSPLGQSMIIPAFLLVPRLLMVGWSIISCTLYALFSIFCWIPQGLYYFIEGVSLVAFSMIQTTVITLFGPVRWLTFGAAYSIICDAFWTKETALDKAAAASIVHMSKGTAEGSIKKSRQHGEGGLFNLAHEEECEHGFIMDYYRTPNETILP